MAIKTTLPVHQLIESEVINKWVWIKRLKSTLPNAQIDIYYSSETNQQITCDISFKGPVHFGTCILGGITNITYVNLGIGSSKWILHVICINVIKGKHPWRFYQSGNLRTCCWEVVMMIQVSFWLLEKPWGVLKNSNVRRDYVRKLAAVNFTGISE